MLVLLHGVAGGWDEFAIAVAAFVVLWVAVKLAGRKAADEDEALEAAPDDVRVAPEAEHPTPTS